MPDDDTLEDDPETLRARIADLEKKQSDLALDNAMLAAGVDLDSKTGQMFRKAWDGDPDPAKIKTEAEQIVGALKAAPTPEPEATGEADPVTREPGEEGQFAERNALSQGDPAGAPDPNPQDDAFKRLDQKIQTGSRVEDAAGVTLQELVTAANAGDMRVLAKTAQD